MRTTFSVKNIYFNLTLLTDKLYYLIYIYEESS